MTVVTEEEFSKLSQLCKISFTEEEKCLLLPRLEKIVSYMNLLSELDTKDVSPCYQPTEITEDTLEDDIEGPLLATSDFLINVPSKVGTLIRVPSVMKPRK